MKWGIDDTLLVLAHIWGGTLGIAMGHHHHAIGDRPAFSPAYGGIWGRGFLWDSVSLIRAPKRESDHQRYNGEKLLFGKRAHVKCALLALEGLGKQRFFPFGGGHEKRGVQRRICAFFLCASRFE